VGPEHGAFLCGIVKKVRPSKPVALLAFYDTENPPNTPADRIVYRNDPRQLLIEINEMLWTGDRKWMPEQPVLEYDR
jgi:hypothetical protein